MLRLTTYDIASYAAKKLAKALGNIPIHNFEGDRNVHPDDKVINWGRANMRATNIWLNKPEAIITCTDKLKTYEAFQRAGVPTPTIIRDLATAQGWWVYGHGVYCRDTSTGMRGEGMTFHQKGINNVPVRPSLYYTVRFPTTREFRVYVFGTQTMVFEKKRRNGTNPDEYIRANDDWVYCLNNLEPWPYELWQVAINAVKACGLDFGGVDCAIDAHSNVVVFEVNSAPYLDDRAATWLADLIREKFDERCEAEAPQETEEVDIVDRLNDRGDALSLRAASLITQLRRS
jgi:hypothetical protein